jgi:Zn-dependent peptidase ImmA (M78 family)
MGRSIEVPVTTSVLLWATDESGYDREQIARSVGVSLAVFDQWLSGKNKPNLTQTRKLAKKLHRPLAALLLPKPPKPRPLSVEFRHPIDGRREPNPVERRHLRRAARFQELISWISTELAAEKPKTPSASIDDDPASVATKVRELLKIKNQRAWASSSAAFDEWRAVLEETGHLVFLFSLGKDSCRGFSLWNDLAPIIAINTAWNESARIFTLFHEMGHLVTRTSSACIEAIRTASRFDPVERWCERFAAGVLMPREEVAKTLRTYGWRPGSYITDLSVAMRIANAYKVSLRAATIRLIELEVATWSLYDTIPTISDRKKGGGGGHGRNRTQIREDQLGDRATSLLVAAVEREVLSRSQAVEVLDIPDTAFDELTHAGHRTS